MTDKESLNHSMKPEKKPVWGKLLGVAALLIAFVALWYGGGGEKNKAGKTDQKTVPQESGSPAAIVKETVAPTTLAPPPPTVAVKKIPEAQQARLAEQPPPSLGMTPEEFRLRFNKTSELVKSKLRIKKLNMVAGSSHNTFRHVFNENLYLTGEVNKSDGSLAEVNFAGILNGSLATTVDLNVSFGTIITAFSPKLSLGERDAILYDLGISNRDADIYTLNKGITKNGITYWVKSSRASGIRFGARSANG